MGGRRTRSAARLAALATLAALTAGSTAAAAGPGASLRAQAAALGSSAHRALLGLYSLDTQLSAVQARLASLRREAAGLRAQQELLAQQISATHRTLVASQRQLGQNLRTLYKEGDVSALAVVLGSQSLDDAVTKLDDLRNVADQSRQVAQVTMAASERLARLRTTLAARRAGIDAAAADAARTATSLEATRAARVSFIAGLRSREQLKQAQIATLDAAAQRSAKKSQELQAAAVAGDAATGVSSGAPATTDPATTTPAAPATPPPPPSGGRTLTVTSTGYSLPGRTATGLPVGWGIVAVDPAVIPLGTRLTIPGYGDGVAADTGGAVRGDTIDLWFPTLAQARAWGRRTVTVTLH